MNMHKVSVVVVPIVLTLILIGSGTVQAITLMSEPFTYADGFVVPNNGGHGYHANTK